MADFSYTELARRDHDAGLCRFVREATARIKSRGADMHKGLIAIGADLKGVRERLDHGDWEAWLLYEFKWSPATARRLIHLHDRFSQTPPEMLDNLSRTALYALAEPSTPVEVVEEVVEESRGGRRVTEAEVRSRKSRKPTPAPQPAGPIPMAGIRNERRRLRDIEKYLKGLRSELSKILAEYQRRPEMAPALAGLENMADDLHTAYKELIRRVIPEGPCPHCEGESPEGCAGCGGAGWSPKATFYELDKEREPWA